MEREKNRKAFPPFWAGLGGREFRAIMGYLPPVEQTGAFECPGNQCWKSPTQFSGIWDPKFSRCFCKCWFIAQEGCAQHGWPKGEWAGPHRDWGQTSPMQERQLWQEHHFLREAKGSVGTLQGKAEASFGLNGSWKRCLRGLHCATTNRNQSTGQRCRI